jgi:kumamolisin
MSLQPNQIPVPGSKREPYRNAKAVGALNPDERLEVTIVLKRRQPLDQEALLKPYDAQSNGVSRRAVMSREQFASSLSAAPDDLAKIEKFAKEHHLSVVRSDLNRRSVVLAGTVADCNAAFGVDLQHFEYDEGTYRGRTGDVHIPSDLTDIVEAVLGLDNRPQARLHLRAHAGPRALTPLEVARLYNTPTGLDGSGQCIAIIELGGGYRPADLNAYFSQLGINPPPSVVAVSVDGAKNSPGVDADGEVMLDIEVAAAIAPKAKIAVYFAPNTDSGFLNALTKATHDDFFNPSVISISWGSSEKNWTAQAMDAFNSALADAAKLGVTVCVAAGDNGSSDGVSDGKDHVDFPASSPFALGCGGTRLIGSGGTITSETVWDDDPKSSATGGGISSYFPRPAYQQPLSASIAKRGVPDVSGNADPETGYIVRVDGSSTVIGGTSAVAPLWAGFIALWNQASGGRVGFLNPLFYSPNGSKAFHDITVGNNGTFQAGPGWDACTGWGSPNVRKILELVSPSKAKPPVAAEDPVAV